jgi:hypothetical protein
MNLQDHLQRCFEKAENEESKLCQEILEMEGMSGQMTRHFYNNLVSLESARYLEIGTWKGSSTFSAMYRNQANILCIDNWSEFDGQEAKKSFLANLEVYKGKNQVEYREGDCFQMDMTSLPKRNLYLYDGGHSVEDHTRALTHYIDCMDDEFIYICDDWDWAAVREGTWKAIHALGLEVVFSIERSLNEGDNWKPKGYAEATWWNGIWAAVLRKPKVSN